MGIYDDCMSLKEEDLKQIAKEMGMKEDVDFGDKKVKHAFCRVLEAAFEETGPKQAAHATVLWRLAGKAWL